MSETINTHQNNGVGRAGLFAAEKIEELLHFDESLSTRISEIEAGLSPNGHSPNGMIEDALSSDGDAQERFIDEYKWALSIAIFPHRHKENKDVLMSAAVDGLFGAAESYEPEKEPNFLRHLSSGLSSYLAGVFGKETIDLPSADEFEDFVLNTLDAEIPPLATERKIGDFSIGQRVLMLSEADLTMAKIHSVTPYPDGMWKFAPATEIPSDERQRRLQEFEERKKQLRRERSTAHPDPELLRLAIRMQPRFQHMVPDKRQGFVHLKSTGEDGKPTHGKIIDIEWNTFIPFDAWRRIKSDEGFKEAYLSNGSKESLRQREVLEKAIGQRIVKESEIGTKAVERDHSDARPPRRARPREARVSSPSIIPVRQVS